MLGFVIGEELAEFLTSGGNSMVVATRDAALRPHAVRACGVRAIAQDRLSVLLPKATGQQALANLRATRDVAVCIASALAFRTVQLKGRYIGAADASAEDVFLSEQQLSRLADAVARFGHTRAQTRNLWLFETWNVEILVTSGFAQTPGPGAGARIGGLPA